MRIFLILVVVAIATPATAGPMCDGLPVTGVGGTEDDDVIVLLAGNDQVDGFEGNDVICGNRGNDDILGGWGNDRLFGGPGSDVVRAWGGDDLLDGGGGDDVLGTPELPVGDQRGHDLYVGGAGNDHLYALDAEEAERVLGGRGQDYIAARDAGSEPEIIRGGRGADTCFVDIHIDFVTGCERINSGH
jgi:Ca2+-binding RTX toxin-like protein